VDEFAQYRSVVAGGVVHQHFGRRVARVVNEPRVPGQPGGTVIARTIPIGGQPVGTPVAVEVDGDTAQAPGAVDEIVGWQRGARQPAGRGGRPVENRRRKAGDAVGGAFEDGSEAGLPRSRRLVVIEAVDFHSIAVGLGRDRGEAQSLPERNSGTESRGDVAAGLVRQVNRQVVSMARKRIGAVVDPNRVFLRRRADAEFLVHVVDRVAVDVRQAAYAPFVHDMRDAVAHPGIVAVAEHKRSAAAYVDGERSRTRAAARVGDRAVGYDFPVRLGNGPVLGAVGAVVTVDRDELDSTETEAGGRSMAHARGETVLGDVRRAAGD